MVLEIGGTGDIIRSDGGLVRPCCNLRQRSPGISMIVLSINVGEAT